MRTPCASFGAIFTVWPIVFLNMTIDYVICGNQILILWKSSLQLAATVKSNVVSYVICFCLFVYLYLCSCLCLCMFGFVSVFVFAIVLSPFWWRLRGPWLCIFVYLWSVVLKSFIVAWALWAGLAPWWESAAIATRLLTAQDHISISRSLGPTSIQPQPDASNNKSHLFDAPSRSRLMADLSIWKSHP